MTYNTEPDIDQATADLIIQIQLEDACLYFENSKGKSRDPTDEEIAFRKQQEDLQNISHLHNDRRMAISVAAAVQDDAQVIAEIEAEERTATRDRELARNWRGDRPAEEAQSELDTGYLDDKILEKLQALNMTSAKGYNEDDSESPGHAESSAWAATRVPSKPTPMHHCVACREITEPLNIVRASCCHEYCRYCLEELFEAAMTDETLFPPRCCQQPIPIETVQTVLPLDLLKRYEKRRIEFETQNKTYCYSPQCSAFIPPSSIKNDIAVCPECSLKTCRDCKGQAHTGDCPSDTAMQQLLKIARENHWQRCFSCWRVVELLHGCNHMVCRCGAEFCYNCGTRWKKCTCAEWDPYRLRARAYQIIDRDANRPADEAPEDADVAKTMQTLRENHETDCDTIQDLDLT
ncbi:hypothetical protein BDV06DRAFT_213806 [Aspergillus oleicola]